MEMGATILGATRAMATEVTVHGLETAADGAMEATRRALEVFHDVERTCTRFDPRSPSMRMNVSAARWHEVPATLHWAVWEAHRAHQKTKGRFDPRVLNDLVRLGYDRSLAFSRVRGADAKQRWRFASATTVETPLPGRAPPSGSGGRDPVDLGGVGKGLAVRWAAEQLVRWVPAFL